MSRLVRDFIEIKDATSLDTLIARLVEVRDALPPEHGAEVKLRGDDFFGRQLAVAFYRPQTQEEAECDARYADAYRESRRRELSKLEDEFGVQCRIPRGRGRLRAVA